MQSYTKQEAQNISRTFSLVIFNHGKDYKAVEIESDIAFNVAMDKARNFPLMNGEKLTVYRGSIGGNGGAHEIYTRKGEK